MDFSMIKFDEKGLVPAVVQEADTKKVLMLAYMNEESLKKTIETKRTWFFSRSRNELWNKGATSGNVQDVVSVSYDCDGDTLLVLVKQTGVACHTGAYTCFNDYLYEGEEKEAADIIQRVYDRVMDRKNNPKEGSYTNYLFDKGIDKILKKVGEENAEVIIAAKNNARDEIVYETCDLIYHTIVMMIDRGVSIGEIKTELNSRFK
ncbi:MAG: bifunctional phosphoribosyl-AMP cyclohydrolase/phosphoribosyl-ATP diphosphatase HisIE [Clostridia bacterium]|nr:bifunctional phosphoribosyl-AMP cyclohydrolase/phosphoribosyl-ATP diphosphatase HisIE [Clostridia bacterium]